MDKILIRGLRVFAYHGVNPEEKQDGQPFELDITLCRDLSAAGESDDLAQTVSYAKAAKRAAAVLTATSYDLLERAATVVAETLLAEFPVDEVTVRLKKPQAPVALDFDYMGVEITRRAKRTVSA